MKKQLEWKRIKHNLGSSAYRAQVPGGWLVMFVDDANVTENGCYEWRSQPTFVPDPVHEWEIDEEVF